MPPVEHQPIGTPHTECHHWFAGAVCSARASIRPGARRSDRARRSARFARSASTGRGDVGNLGARPSS